MSQSNQMNLCRHLHTAASNYPTDLAVAVQKRSFNQYKYQEINFDQLNKQSDLVAHALCQYGLKAGDKAVLMVTPSIDFFAITFALFKAGIIPIIVDPGMGIKNLKQCFIESQPDAFIGISKAHLARKLFAWGKHTIKYNISVAGPALFGGSSLKRLLNAAKTDAPFEMVKLSPEQICAILFTSGSTGSPKGVVYSHKMFEAQIASLKQDYQIKHGEKDLATFPLFSLFGPALGMASIIPDMDASKPITANPAHIFKAIEKYQCTNMFANPALIELLGTAGAIDHTKLLSLQRVISAGAPATLPSIERFVKLLGPQCEVLNSYGATESLPVSMIASSELLKTQVITDTGGGICVGNAINNSQIYIISNTPDNITQWSPSLCLPTYEIGEIVVEGDQVSQSYYQRDDATSTAKIANGQVQLHRMGDLGYLDEHDKLWMCGRKNHAVYSNHLAIDKVFYSIPCERIFNTHQLVKRSALVTISVDGKQYPLICLELNSTAPTSTMLLFNELKFIAARHQHTSGITEFLVHDAFPMDIRHNAKIYREKLQVWAQAKIEKSK